MKEFRWWEVVWMNAAGAVILAALVVGAYTLDILDFVLRGRLSNAVVRRFKSPERPER